MIALLLFILALDSMILTRSARELRIRLEQACDYAARDAVIERRAYEAGGMAKYLAKTSGAYTLDNLTGDLFIPVMPPGFTLPLGINSTALPFTDCGGATNCGFSWGSNRFNCTCSKKVNAGDPPEFKDFTAANVHQDFDAGNYTGCTARATVRRFFLPNSTISASAAFWSVPYGLRPVGDSAGNNPPIISVAIAPQVSELAPVAATHAYFPTAVIEDSAQAFRYINQIVNNGSQANRDYFRSSVNGGDTGYLAEPDFNLRQATPPIISRRNELSAVCESPSVLVRQRLSSALLELLSRNGLTRAQTQLLVTNPAYVSTNPIQPTLVTPRGDINARNSFLPLMQTRIKYPIGTFPSFDNAHWIQPVYPDGRLGELTSGSLAYGTAERARIDYEALVARLPGLCYHADYSDRDRVGLSQAAFSNDGYEDSNVDYPIASRLWDGNYSGDLIGNNLVYLDHLRSIDASPNAIGPQRKLKSAEVASILGASLRCPYTSDATGFQPCPFNNLPIFTPDLIGLIQAWRGMTDPFANGTTLNLPQAAPHQDTNHALVLFIHDFDLNNLSAATGQINFGTVAPDIDISLTGPITVVYIPTDAASADPATLSAAFRTNLCAPTVQTGGRRGNTLIPIISKGMAHVFFGQEGADCMVGMSACFDYDTNSSNHFFITPEDQNDLENVWNCLLTSNSGREAENFTLSQIYQTNLMHTVRRL